MWDGYIINSTEAYFPPVSTPASVPYIKYSDYTQVSSKAETAGGGERRVRRPIQKSPTAMNLRGAASRLPSEVVPHGQDLTLK